MARLLYVLHHATDAPERAATALAAAAAGVEAGHEVALWLASEGVRLGVRGVAEVFQAPYPRSPTDSLTSLAAHGATLHCSSPCFAARGFEADVLRPGAVLAEPAALAQLVGDGWIPIPA